MNRLRQSVLFFALIVSLNTLAAAQGSQSAQSALRAAIDTETLKGDLPGAIQQYRQLVDKFARSDKAVAAQALLRMADCHQKLGNGQAQTAYERLISEFGDQIEAQTARTRLQALTSAAGPFPERPLPELPQLNKGFSPDGRFVVFQQITSTRTTQEASIVARDLQTGQDRTIVAGLKGPVGALHFTPDSQWLVTTTDVLPRVEGLHKEQLVIASLNSAKPPVILEASAGPAGSDGRFFPPLNASLNRLARSPISPDSKWLAYLAPAETPDRFEARVLTFATGASQPLGISVGRRNGWVDFQWSPSSNEIAMHITEEEKPLEEIRVISLSNLQSRSIPFRTEKNHYARLDGWTTRGDLIAREVPFVNGQPTKVSLVNLKSGERRITCSSTARTVAESDRRDLWQFLNTDLCLGFSADGAKQIVWKASSKQLNVRDSVTGVDQPLTRGSGEEQPGFLSPDRRFEIFAANRDGKWAYYAAPIDQAPVAAPAIVARFDGPPTLFSQEVQWIADGIVASMTFSEDHIYRVTMDPVLGIATGDLERLTQDAVSNYAPSISPDSRHIAYWSERGLSVMDAATGANERVLAARPQRVTSGPVKWRSADELLTLISRVGEERELTTVNVRTGAISPLLIRGEARAIDVHTGAWDYARSTDEVVYVKRVPGGIKDAREIRLFSLADGTDRLASRIDEPEGSIFDLRISPDGKRIVYLLNNQLNKTPKANELGVITIGEPGRRVLFNPTGMPVPASISPDGRFLLFGGQRPRIMDLTSTKEWPLMSDPAKQPVWGEEAWASWSPDGIFISLTVGSSKNQLRVWTGLTADAVVKQIKR